MWGAGMLVAVALFILVEARAEDPIIPLSLFKNRTFINATAIGFVLGLGMFAALAFLPTFLQMSSGTSAAVSGLLTLPMMVGMMGTSIWSGLRITKTGKYRAYPIAGTAITVVVLLIMSTMTGSTPLWLICTYLFFFGVGLGLVMQVVVLVVQNSVDPHDVGTATSTNNYFREVGAALGVAVFGTLFTNRLGDRLFEVFAAAGMSPEEIAAAASTVSPAAVKDMPAEMKQGVIDSYADALAPVFLYMVPFLVLAFVIALFIKQIKLSDEAGMVARGEALADPAKAAVLSDESAELALVGAATGGSGAIDDSTAPGVEHDQAELTSSDLKES